MNISYNIIVEYLRNYLSERNVLFDANKEFDIVELLPDTAADVNTEHLYFSTLPDLIDSPYANVNNMYIISVDDTEIESISENAKCNLILVTYDCSQTELFNSVLGLFIRANNWERDMERAIADRATLQDLLNISGTFFRKPVFIFDYALQTLAHTNNEEISDDIVNAILKNGGIPNNYIQFIIDNGILSKAKKFRELGVLCNQKVHPFNLLLRTMTANLLNVDSIVMLLGREQPQPADYDYMRYFIRKLDRYIDIYYNNRELQVKSSQSFFSDCIEGKIGSTEEMERGSLLVGIPYTGRFSLSCVRFESFSYSSANFLIKVLETANPFAVIFIYKQEVILVNNEQKFLNSEADNETIKSRSDVYLKKHNAKLGISSLCYNFFDLRISYMQASAAIELGTLMEPQKFRYRYRDYFFYHVISCASKFIDLKYLYSQKLNPLIEYDREHNMDNLKLLEVYITHEYSVSQTAEIMHLHRNSVIYRLDKIKTLLGESCWDPTFRANLLLSCYTRRLINATEKSENSQINY